MLLVCNCKRLPSQGCRPAVTNKTGVGVPRGLQAKSHLTWNIIYLYTVHLPIYNYPPFHLLLGFLVVLYISSLGSVSSFANRVMWLGQKLEKHLCVWEKERMPCLLCLRVAMRSLEDINTSSSGTYLFLGRDVE